MDPDEQFDANDEDVLSSSYQGELLHKRDIFQVSFFSCFPLLLHVIGGENGSGRTARQPHVIQLPLTRVKNIIKSDPDMGLAGQEAVLLIAKVPPRRCKHIHSSHSSTGHRTVHRLRRPPVSRAHSPSKKKNCAEARPRRMHPYTR